VSDFLMPSLGADMESAILVEWSARPGDTLRRGDIIGVVETEKGAIEIEVFEDCVVEELVVAVGTEVRVDGVLARLRGLREAAAPAVAPVAPTPSPAAAVAPPPVARPAAPQRPPATLAVPLPPATRVRASPAARRRAQALGVDPGILVGTGVSGAVCLADVELAAAAAPARKTRGGFDPAAMRRAIGNAMSRSKREIPHYYLTQSIPLGTALAWLGRENESRPVTERLLPAALLLKATALALAKAPALNGFFADGAFTAGRGIHIGWAISLRGGGLLAPALHDANRLSLTELMAKLRDLVQRARTGGLRSSEMMDPTITVTSLGERSAESVLPIIYPPQVAVIGFGSVNERPWADAGRIESQPVIVATLGADHRVSDGHRGGQLLAEIDHNLQHPEVL
jgi:pyruvate dehydrogenase E2 component (dihydrolipoamide acetyltransferase)